MAHFITDKCIGCATCARNCPVEAITGELQVQFEIDPDLCIDCGVCAANCPENAILAPGEEAAESTAEPAVKAVAEPTETTGEAAAEWVNSTPEPELVEFIAEDVPKPDKPVFKDETADTPKNEPGRPAADSLAAAEAKTAEVVPRKERVKLHPEFDKASCAGCSVCIQNCPKNVLALSAPKKHGDIHTVAYLTDPDGCIGCGICAKECPINAIYMVGPDEKPVYVNHTKGLFDMFKKLYCRIFQAVMKVANYFLGYRMPEYISGPGSIRKLPGLMKAKGANNALVVTDSNLMQLGLLDNMLKALEDAGLHYTVFSDLAVNPTTRNVEEGYLIYKKNQCECLVAFGGGAPMDCAKGIGAKVCHPKKTATQMQGVLKVLHKLPLFFAIPTTAGTGSETTVAAVITDDETHHKASINDPNLIPNYAILDPELTKGLPPKVTSTTGMDALCHAVEAYTNKTYNTPLEDHLAKDAVRLIHKSLLTAYQDGSNLDARQDMQFAAFFAGRAFTRGCVGYVHAVGHTLGGLYGVAHGLAMSVILPHVMRQFGPAVYARLADLADVCCMDGDDDKEKALNFIQWIEDMKRQMDIPDKFDCIREEDIPQIIKWAMAEANPLYPTPVTWNKKDFQQLIAGISE